MTTNKVHSLIYSLGVIFTICILKFGSIRVKIQSCHIALTAIKGRMELFRGNLKKFSFSKTFYPEWTYHVQLFELGHTDFFLVPPDGVAWAFGCLSLFCLMDQVKLRFYQTIAFSRMLSCFATWLQALLY